MMLPYETIEAMAREAILGKNCRYANRLNPAQERLIRMLLDFGLLVAERADQESEKENSGKYYGLTP